MGLIQDAKRVKYATELLDHMKALQSRADDIKAQYIQRMEQLVKLRALLVSEGFDQGELDELDGVVTQLKSLPDQLAAELNASQQ